MRSGALQGLGLRVWGLGFRVYVGLRVCGLPAGFESVGVEAAVLDIATRLIGWGQFYVSEFT